MRRIAFIMSFLSACSASTVKPDEGPCETSSVVPSEAIQAAVSCASSSISCSTATWLLLFEDGVGDEVLDLSACGSHDVRLVDGRSLRIARRADRDRLQQQKETTPAVQLYVFERSATMLRGEFGPVWLGNDSSSTDLCLRAFVTVQRVGSGWQCNADKQGLKTDTATVEQLNPPPR